MPIWFRLATFAIDALKNGAGASLLRSVLPDLSKLEEPGGATLFASLAAVIFPALAASAGAALHLAPGQTYGSEWIGWFSVDALTNIILTLTILYWILYFQGKSSTPRREPSEGILLFVGLIAATIATFALPAPDGQGRPPALMYAPLPFLLWAAARFGPRGACSAILVVAGTAIWSAAGGHRPFLLTPLADRELAVQVLLFSIGLPTIALAVFMQERFRIGEALRLSERQLAMAAGALRLGFWSWRGRAGNFWMSGTLGALIGLPLDCELTPENFFGNPSPEDRAAIDKAIGTCVATLTKVDLQYRISMPDGSIRWIEMRGRCEVDEHGRFKQITGMSIDVTAQKAAESQMLTHLEEIAHTSRLAALGELTASIAHEVNQPLGAILANAEAASMMLREAEPPLDVIREILSDIRADDARATEVIQRLRMLMRKREVVSQPLDFNQLIGDVVRFVAFDAEHRGITISTDLADALPAVQGDTLLLQQVLLNILLNSMDAMAGTPERDRCLCISSSTGEEGWIECVVRDRGPGIPVERLPRIFDSFFTTKPDGVGLGLSIARSIIQMHQGRIWVENNTGRGAAFHITLHPADAVVAD
jgi:signal transduction histidine kinase/integral membrane sensor domain MASE1